MSAWEGPTGELATLLSTLSDGRLSHAQYERLTQIISDDPEARKLYLRWVFLESRLQRQFGVLGTPLRPQDDASSILMEVLEEEQRLRAQRAAAEAERQAQQACDRDRMWSLLTGGDSIDLTPVRHVVIPKFAFYGTLAAMAALVLFALFMSFHRPGAPSVVPGPSVVATPVARVAQSVNARWADDTLATTPGTLLYPGTHMLRRGMVRIVYDNDATLIIEAPATFELVSGDRVMLHQGKLVGEAPARAFGFTVRTPSASVIDLGTEFGVAVDAGGATTVQVFDGKVSLRSRGVEEREAQPSEELFAGDARQVDAAGERVRVIEARPLTFVRREEFEAHVNASISAYHRWLAYSYAVRRRDDLVVYYPFELDAAHPNRLFNAAVMTRGRLDGRFEGLGGLPRWTTGRWPEKQAVQFNRAARTMIRTPFDNLLHIENELTVAVWVRLTDLSASQHLVTRRQVQPRIDALNLVWNGDDKPESGFPPRSILFNTGQDPGRYHGMFIPAPTVQPGQWVHLAVTYDREGVGYYIDGQLVGRRPPRQPLPACTADLLIGGVELELYPTETFDGLIDELAIFKRALSAQEIAELYAVGDPQPFASQRDRADGHDTP